MFLYTCFKFSFKGCFLLTRNLKTFIMGAGIYAFSENIYFILTKQILGQPLKEVSPQNKYGTIF